MSKLSIYCKQSNAAISSLGESLNQLLTGLEDMSGGRGAGASGGGPIRIPKAMERDLRHVMDLESPFCSPAVARRRLKQLQYEDKDDGNEGDDEVSLEEDLSFPFSPEECSQVAQLLSLGLMSHDGASNKMDFLKGGNDDDNEATGGVDFNQEDLMREMERMMDMDQGAEELNIPWLLAAGAGNIFDKNETGMINIPWLMAAASSPSSKGTVEPTYASLPDKLTILNEDEDEKKSKEEHKSEKWEYFYCAEPFINRINIFGFFFSINSVVT